MTAERAVEIDRGRRHHFLVDRTDLMDQTVLGCTVEVQRTEIDVVLDGVVVVGKDGLGIQARQDVESECLRSADPEVRGGVLPVLVLVEGVVGIGGIASGPFLTVGGSRPVEREEKVPGLHEIVGTCASGVVESALDSSGDTCRGGEFKTFSNLLIEVDPAGETAEAVDLDAALFVGVGERGIVGTPVGAAADGKVIALVDCSPEKGIVPVEVVAFPATRVFIFGNLHALVPSALRVG